MRRCLTRNEKKNTVYRKNQIFYKSDQSNLFSKLSSTKLYLRSDKVTLVNNLIIIEWSLSDILTQKVYLSTINFQVRGSCHRIRISFGNLSPASSSCTASERAQSSQLTKNSAVSFTSPSTMQSADSHSAQLIWRVTSKQKQALEIHGRWVA